MMLALSHADVSHATVEVVFVLFIFFIVGFLIFIAARINTNSKNLSTLVTDNQADRVARDRALVIVKQETLALAKEQQEARRVLTEKIDENTAMTIAATKASDNAATVANSFNEKIAETNQRLLEQVQGSTRKEADSLHQHIEHGVDAVKEKIDESKGNS